MLTFFVFLGEVFLDVVVFFVFKADLVSLSSLLDVLISLSFSAFNIFSASSLETSFVFALASFLISFIIFPHKLTLLNLL